MASLVSDWPRNCQLLWNPWTEFKETWQEARSQRHLPRLCFTPGLENKMAAPASDWPRDFSASPLTPLDQSHRNLTGNKISTSSTYIVFFMPMSKRLPDWSVKKLAHYTLVHELWPFGPLVFSSCSKGHNHICAFWPWKSIYIYIILSS